jgi:hypothetical protein
VLSKNVNTFPGSTINLSINKGTDVDISLQSPRVAAYTSLTPGAFSSTLEKMTVDEKKPTDFVISQPFLIRRSG